MGTYKTGMVGLDSGYGEVYYPPVTKTVGQIVRSSDVTSRKEKNSGQTTNGGGIVTTKCPTEPILSGESWCTKFPDNKSLDGLDKKFREKVDCFIKKIKEEKATFTINSTRRPEERAYLMHWAWKIARNGYDPRKVPPRNCVNIKWWHGDENLYKSMNAAGKQEQEAKDLKKSREVAKEMVKKYGLLYPPSLTSNHIQGKAIDMSSTLSHKRLIEIGNDCGVYPKKGDPVHWSINGR